VGGPMTRYAVEHHDPKSERARRRASVVDRDQLARFRYHCVLTYREATGAQHERVAAVAAAIDGGTIPLPALVPGQRLESLHPSRLSLTRWDKRAGAPATIEALRDAARSGRPRLTWSPAMTQALETAVGAAQPLHVVVEKVREAARAEGLRSPAENTIKRAVRRLPPEFRRIAVHGPHAAKAGALRHGAVSTTMPLEWLSLDFAELPIAVRAQGKTDRLIVKPGVVLITDWFSGVIVGYALVDPSLRARTGSYVTEDVHAALCGVFYPEFAMPACVAYSGALPMGLRFDRAAMHTEVRALTDYGVQIPNLPGYAPHRNGKVEATHILVKRLVDRLVGSTQHWRVLDADALLKGTAGKKPATALDPDNLKRAEPQRWRLPCRVDDLPTFPQFAEAFDDLVHQINHEDVSEGPGGGVTTRHHRFMAHRQLDRLRPGRDGWPLLEVLTCRVESRGIRFHQIGRMAAVTRDGTELDVGASATIRLHPLWAGAFVVVDDQHEVVAPHAEWARGVNPASLAYEHNQARRAARIRVKVAQDTTMRDALGDLSAVFNQELEAVEQRGLAPDIEMPSTVPAESRTDAPVKPQATRTRQRAGSAKRTTAATDVVPITSSPIAERLQRAAMLPRVTSTPASGRPAGLTLARGPFRHATRPIPAAAVPPVFPHSTEERAG
jgi:hypothetical protein